MDGYLRQRELWLVYVHNFCKRCSHHLHFSGGRSNRRYGHRNGYFRHRPDPKGLVASDHNRRNLFGLYVAGSDWAP